ncbi:hypothetical protein B0H13DRAFT_1053213 [Mycena leptocephala]|nr:hypothetical protein B0H13DRAFT_1053213 [Mycena leptocephala]
MYADYPGMQTRYPYIGWIRFRHQHHQDLQRCEETQSVGATAAGRASTCSILQLRGLSCVLEASTVCFRCLRIIDICRLDLHSARVYHPARRVIWRALALEAYGNTFAYLRAGARHTANLDVGSLRVSARTSTFACPSCLLCACIGRKQGLLSLVSHQPAMHIGRRDAASRVRPLHRTRQALPTYGSPRARRRRRDTIAAGVPRVIYSSPSRIRSLAIEKTKMRDCNPVCCLEKSDPVLVAALVVWRGCRSLKRAVACPVFMFGGCTSHRSMASARPRARAPRARARDRCAMPVPTSPSLRSMRSENEDETSALLPSWPALHVFLVCPARILVHPLPYSWLSSHQRGEHASKTDMCQCLAAR